MSDRRGAELELTQSGDLFALQQCLESLTSAVKSDFDIARCNVQQEGNFVGREFLDVPQDQDNSIIIRQKVDALSDHRPGF